MKINYFKKSLKTLKKMVKYNKNLTKREWDEFANENALFSSFTM